MIINTKELEKYPDVMSKDQFRKACHISCRKARWLLETGLVPCSKTNKKTHCYLIKKTDVIAFVDDYVKNPIKYSMPSSGGNKKSSAQEYICFSDISHQAVVDFYISVYENEPDMLTIARVSELTGYANSTICHWVKKRALRSYCKKGNAKMIAKRTLINFLASDYYNCLIKKSEIHINMIREINSNYKDR